MRRKRCFKCSGLKKLTDFYRHPTTADGRLNKCKQCTKRDVNRYRHENTEKVRAYDQKRAQEPARKRKSAGYRRTFLARHPGILTAYSQRQRRRNPVKYAAVTAVGNAIRDGKLLRQPCEVCGAKAHAHHDDYRRPLEVRWFCPKHHRELHKRLVAPIPF